MARINCDKCGASWDTEKGDVCPYCGIAQRSEIKTRTDRDKEAGTTIINNYYGVQSVGEENRSNPRINDRGEPKGLSEKELKVYYQPRPKIIWLAVMAYVLCVAIMGFILAEICDFEELIVAIVTVCVAIVPIIAYLCVKKYQQAKWDKLHEKAREIKKNQDYNG